MIKRLSAQDHRTQPHGCQCRASGLRRRGIAHPPAGTDLDVSVDYLAKRGVGHGGTFTYGRDGFLGIPGPASGLGIPVGNQFKLWPQTIAGEKVNLIILDDASDPGKGVQNARRFVTDDKVDMIFGGSITTVSAAIAPVASEAKTTQISIAPVGVPPEQERWVFRLPQGFTVMAYPIVEHMKKSGVKTVGFLGYTDAYGELWLKEITAQAEKAGIKIVAVERFARSDTSARASRKKSFRPRSSLSVCPSPAGARWPLRSRRAIFLGRYSFSTHSSPSSRSTAR